ncbi:hypothetical protein DES53_102574 [Roseimicrobium gellanilyticum]|uniref:Sensory transduction regulator n=1 Tax=Roseimicrobium gellanilyticum TaxID=748857 RepID=A0A366HSV6_9BACT|nr:YbjN domain-containing protein [Roseimicrobium gellanilyticum]RBP46188.1 hypothetical protein DES53_102574 [Roseimicrobium gellanilyticum]
MSEETKSPLEALIEPLEEFEYFADHQPAADESVFERLYISLNVDDPQPDREYGVEVFFINDVTEAFGAQEEEEDAIIAQFMLILPFRIQVDGYLEIMRFCNLVNRMLPLGAFGLSEQDEAVFLRYCLATESRAIPHDVLLEVVSAMEYACKAYASQFEALSAGTMKYDDIVREVEESGQQLPSVGDPALFASA